MVVGAVVALLFVAAIAWNRVQPLSSGEWAPAHARVAYAEMDGPEVTIHNVRNFRYRSVNDFDAQYESRRYDLDQLNSVWYIVTPFGSGQGAAHTFLSFGFADSTYVSVSVEARRQPDEGYSLIGGMMKRYELIYVIGDERDLIGVRAQHRGNTVHAYPIRTNAEKMRAVFVNVLKRANALRDMPEFYNTFTNNCTTSVLKHVNEVADERIPYGLKILLPARSDRLAYDRGLIDTDLPFHEAKARFDVTARAVAAGDAPDFSTQIRTPPRGAP